MDWTVRTPAGYTLTMLPPGTSEGAETNPDFYLIATNSDKRKVESTYGHSIIRPRYVHGGAPLGLKQGVYNDSFAKKMAP